MIQVKDLAKKYGNHIVVDDVSVHIEQGKITSFIGPNGAGKSTLLSMMSRLLTKDNGEIYLQNKEISTCKNCDLAKKLSILKQSNHLTLRLTVRDLVSFGRFPYSQGNLTAKDWEIVNQSINYMELEEIQNQYIDQLSGGQRQRAFIAMVLAQDTEYIFLDEPLNNLDMKHSVQIMTTLKRLVEDFQKTVVVVIHDINFASCYSDYIIALKNGKVISQGPPEHIIQPSVLKDVYDMDIRVEDIGEHKICVYFSEQICYS